MRASWRPAHLLLLHHPLADDLVDGGLGEGTGDDLASPVTLAVVGDVGGVGPQVAAELADRFAQLALLGTGAVDVEVELEVFDAGTMRIPLGLTGTYRSARWRCRPQSLGVAALPPAATLCHSQPGR